LKIKFDLKGDDEFHRKMGQIRRKMKNLRPLYKAWGIQTMKWIMDNYRSGGRKLKSGGPWKALQPMTVQSRRKRSNKPLLDTGHLMRQWNQRLKSWGVVIGNPMDVALFHEEGTRGPYPIEPKNRQVLWFGVTPAQRRRGQQLGGHQKWRVESKPYKKWGKGRTPGVFARAVMHPGLPARRQLPNEREIMPELMKVTDKFLERMTR
jgi:hypothetical protein